MAAAPSPQHARVTRRRPAFAARVASLRARAFLRGAQCGDADALLNLWRRSKPGVAANNVATWHRDRGNQRLAFSWYRKAAAAHDGDACVALAYGHHYGVGTARHTPHALRALARAERAASISPYGLEEAWYLRPVILRDRGRRGDRAAATSWLRRAAADGDDPEAEVIFADIARGMSPTPCRCRRHLTRSVPRRAPCSRHPPNRWRRNAGRPDGRA